MFHPDNPVKSFLCGESIIRKELSLSSDTDNQDSIVAEFAYSFHANEPRPTLDPPRPVSFPSQVEKLFDIRAVIFDVYGTLLRYWKPEFSSETGKEQALQRSFRKTADYFGITPFLEKMNAEEPPEKTLKDLYQGLIALNHEKTLKKGLSYPEVRIEEIWGVILLMLKRHGYDPASAQLGEERDLAKCMAYHYNGTALGRGLYPGVASSLLALKNNNLQLGIVSNAQFYTPIDLTLFLRDQNEGIDDYRELFEEDLVVYSSIEGVAKPNPALFQRLFDSLYEYHILPEQTVYVGNDLSQDVRPAKRAGMRTAFFAGDAQSAFFHDLAGEVEPDITFADFNELPERICFFSEKQTDGGAA